MSEVTRGDPPEEPGQIVDLVSAVLVDPNLHTDLRMRLHEEIGRILNTASERSAATTPLVPHHRPPRTDGTHLPEMVQAVLSDPNLHTDTRMRLYGEIQAAVSAAREGAARR